MSSTGVEPDSVNELQDNDLRALNETTGAKSGAFRGDVDDSTRRLEKIAEQLAELTEVERDALLAALTARKI